MKNGLVVCSGDSGGEKERENHGRNVVFRCARREETATTLTVQCSAY